MLDISQKLLSLRSVLLQRFHHPWSSFFFHVAAAFSNQSAVQVVSRVHIPVYLINKLQPIIEVF